MTTDKLKEIEDWITDFMGRCYLTEPNAYSQWDSLKLELKVKLLNDTIEPGKELSAEELFLYDTINNEMVEVGSLKDAEKYVIENFTEGNTAHSDYWGFDLFVKVGVVDENANASLVREHKLGEGENLDASVRQDSSSIGDAPFRVLIANQQ
jgi:hypothetical protein